MERILIVDDVPGNISILGEALKTDYIVLQATNGERALEIAHSKEPPDLILLDIVMPGMDGYEVCRRLKNDALTRAIPVIFATVRKKIEDETLGLDLGAVDYILKPYVIPVILARVRTHLQLKRQRDELEEMANHLERLNRSKNRFLGMAAHDLRNPLVLIRGISDLFLDHDQEESPLAEEQLELLGMIRSASDDMLSLVNDLLDISAIESGDLNLQMQYASFNELLKERIKMSRVLAAKKHMTLELSMGEELKGRFDYKRLGQVVDNLISNAIKYSPPGSSICVTLVALEGGARISIHDEGPGISREDSYKLFEEFQKLSAKPTGDEKSTGLGLAIVKRIVEAHKGEVEVVTKEGQGATFSFMIPCEPESHGSK
jgi:signal transduction histidine kinase